MNKLFELFLTSLPAIGKAVTKLAGVVKRQKRENLQEALAAERKLQAEQIAEAQARQEKAEKDAILAHCSAIDEACNKGK